MSRIVLQLGLSAIKKPFALVSRLSGFFMSQGQSLFLFHPLLILDHYVIPSTLL